MTYIIFRLLCNLFDLCCINLCKAAKHWDSFLSNCIFNDNKTWQVVNFYHNTRDNTALQALLSLDIDALMPTLIVGDFKKNSQTWSLPDTP